MKRSAITLMVLLLVLLTSCAGSHGMVRKCDGRKGTRTPMGVM